MPEAPQQPQQQHPRARRRKRSRPGGVYAAAATAAAALALLAALLALGADAWRLPPPPPAAAAAAAASSHRSLLQRGWALPWWHAPHHSAASRVRRRRPSLAPLLRAAGARAAAETGPDEPEEPQEPAVIELTDWVAEAEDLWEGAGPATATTARVAAAYRRRRQQRLGGEEEGGLGSSALAPVGGDGGPSWWWEDGGGYGGGGDGEGDQLPVRIQREVNLLWYELSSGDRMAYLGEEARRRLRQTLVVLAAFRTLFEHPGRALRRQSAQECFRQADVNGDGQVSFAEFLRWFRESQAAASDSGAAATGSALVPFGEGAAARALEGVAMRDLLRRFLTQRGQGEGEEEGGGDGRAAAMGGARSEEQVLEDLDRCIETTQVLLDLEADADTLLAALATYFLGLDTTDTDSTNNDDPDRSEKLAVVRSQCGPIVAQIVRDGSRLGGVFRPPPAGARRVPPRDAPAYHALMDLDHHNAQLARESLLAATSDARAFVVHMAGLVYALRNQHRLPLHRRHLLALEALQLYVPVASALGLGARLREMEELSYRALFPDSYDRFFAWHREFSGLGQLALLRARERIAAGIEARPALRRRLARYEIQGRVKSVVSAFKKVYRKDKLPEELHDLLGLRIVLTPAASSGIDTDADAVEEEGRGKRRKSKARAALRGHTAKTKGALPPASSYVETRGEAGAGAAGAIVEMVTTTSRAGTATAVAAVATAAAGSSLAGDSRVEEGGFFGAGAVGGGDGGLEGRALEAWLCHGVRELIVDMWEEVPGRYKNYVDEPKKNGYQSLHMGVFLMEGGGTAEVQVRTARMHEEAESGGASHALYKAEILTPDKVAAFKSKQQRLPGSSSGPDPSSLQPEASSQEAVVVVSAGAGASAPEP